MSDGFKPPGQLNSITCAGEDGQPIEVSTAASSLLQTGWYGGASYGIYQCQWSPVSFNVDGSSRPPTGHTRLSRVAARSVRTLKMESRNTLILELSQSILFNKILKSLCNISIYILVKKTFRTGPLSSTDRPC